ncbi:unnamed protein product [Symbiodinium natans]|uniref:Uncharacterized protein n=1 Tax=Symbiodinium natans TaxID=878477 RepID=A0A812JAP3_9DINO|nr:unnamed protein product [Symbiodinium natans]
MVKIERLLSAATDELRVKLISEDGDELEAIGKIWKNVELMHAHLGTLGIVSTAGAEMEGFFQRHVESVKQQVGEMLCKAESQSEAFAKDWANQLWHKISFLEGVYNVGMRGDGSAGLNPAIGLRATIRIIIETLPPKNREIFEKRFTNPVHVHMNVFFTRALHSDAASCSPSWGRGRSSYSQVLGEPTCRNALDAAQTLLSECTDSEVQELLNACNRQ